jgi:O-antigen ligase
VSQTRSAWVGVAIAFVVLLFYKAKESKSIKPIISAVVAVFVVIFIIAIINPAIMSILSLILTNRYQSAFETGGSGRTNIWRYGIEIFKYNYLFGTGFMNFPSAFTRYYRDVNISGSMYGIYAGRAAHNIYLGILVETGIIGSSIALISLVSYLYRIIKQRNKEMAYLMVSANIAMLTIGLFLDILNRKYFWFIIAITIASIKLDKQMHELSQYNENEICL